MLTMTFDVLVNRLLQLKHSGPLSIPSNFKNGSGAVGLALEEHLGLTNHSLPEPDWGEYELKTSTSSGKTLTTLFSPTFHFSSEWNAISFIKKYGKPHFSKHLQSPTIRFDHSIPFSTDSIDNVHFRIEESQMQIAAHKTEIGYFNMENLQAHFERKLKNIVFVHCHHENNSFSIENASVFRDASFDQFIENLKTGSIEMSFQYFLVEPDTPRETLKKQTIQFRCILKRIKNLFRSIDNIF